MLISNLTSCDENIEPTSSSGNNGEKANKEETQ